MNIILEELVGKNKTCILNEISQIANEEINISPKNLVDGFKNREELTSTGMIEGIAIPHTMQEIEVPLLIIGKFQPIDDWETLDASKVELVIGIIAPNNGKEHLKILSQISRKLISIENIELLKKAKKVEDIRTIFEI